MCIRDRWFVIPPLLTNVSAPSGETWTPEIVSFQLCRPTTQQAFRSDVVLLRIARRVDAIVLQVDWRRYSEHFFVEKKTKSTVRSESSVVIETRYRAWLKRHNIGLRVSPGSAETLFRKGGMKNDHPFDSVLSQQHLCQNYPNRLMCVEVIVCNISVVFWDTVYNSLSSALRLNSMSLNKFKLKLKRYFLWQW